MALIRQSPARQTLRIASKAGILPPWTRTSSRLASEFLLDGLRYAYKSGDPPPESRVGCTIVDATVALACAADLALTVQAKREIGRLFEDIEGEPYTILFQ